MNNRSFFKLVIFTFLLLFELQITEAVTITVTTRSDVVDNNDGVISLREAIQQTNTASGSDTVLFSSDLTGQTIQLTNGELKITDTLRLTASNLTIDARQLSRVFNIDDANTSRKITVFIEGVSITNGKIDGFSTGGGGIINSENLVLHNCAVSNNSVGSNSDGGAGIRNNGGALTIVKCTISGNTCQGIPLGGGGILIHSGKLSIDSSTINTNTATSLGGGISIYSGEVNIANTQISSNTLTTNGTGGGICSRGNVFLRNVSISQNTANDISGSGNGYGGGIYSSGYMQLIYCTVDANTAYSYQAESVYSGGIHNTGTIYIVNSTISNNRATKYHTAGFAYCGGITNIGTGTIVNSTISGNVGYDAYGGIMNTGTLQVRNCTITGNYDYSSTYNYGGVTSASNTITLANCIIANSNGDRDLIILASGILKLIGVNIVEDGQTSGTLAVDPMLGPLQDNGGFTKTCDPLPGSPAFNAGSNSVIMADTFDLDNDGNITEPIPFDQRGSGFIRVKNTTVDLGAIEHETPPVPGTPTLALPVNSASNLETSLSFSWNAVSGTANYRLQLSTSSDFNTTVVDDSIISTTSRTGNSLSYATTYYWRVRAKNGGGSSAWSDIWSFSTTPALPAIPILSTPVNTATDQALNLIFSWNEVSNVISYRIQLSSTIDFSVLIVDDSSLTANSIALGPLNRSTTYYWRVNAKNGGGTSGWSEIRSFTTIPSAPDIPILNLPVNGATEQPVNLTLSWNTVPRTSLYRVQLSTVSDFSTLLVDDSTFASNSKAVGPLSRNTTYYWRVNARNAGGASAWSETRSFSTLPLAAEIPALTSPVNNANDQPVILTLSWNVVSNASSYRVQLSTTSDFSMLMTDDSTLTMTEKIVSSLSNGSTYYWRVSAKNSGGTSAWSEVRNFTTVPPSAGVPNLSAPANAATDQPINLTLSWNTISGALSYRVQLSSTVDFAESLSDDSTLTTTSKTINSLANGTTYYWRVNAKNSGGTSDWSEVRSFMTVPPTAGVPMLSSPVNTAIDQPNSLSLSWNEAAGASLYRIQISTISDFSTLVVDDSSLVTTIKNISSLSESTTYFWRVSSKNAGGTSDWSEVWNFTTVPPIAGVPMLSAPANTATDQPVSLTLSWNAVSGAVSYRVQLSIDTDFLSHIIDDSALTTPLKVVNSLGNGTTYYWRVCATNAGGTSEWSEVRGFTTIPPAAGVPTLSTPENAAIGQSIGITLSWNAAVGAVSYRIQLSTISDFSTLTIDDSTLTVTEKAVDFLSNSSTYYWRVCAKNTGGISSWSDVRSFTTIPELPEPVMLVAPAVDGTITTDSVLLVWRKSSSAVNIYKVEIFSDSSLSELYSVDSLVTDTLYICRSLQSHKSYWWRVSAHNAAGWGIKAQERKFIVEIPSTAIIPANVSVKIEGISGANGKIRYGLPKNSRVTIKIYDLRGKLLRILVNSEQKAGFHNVSIRDAGIANGNYLLAFRAGNFLKTGKFAIFSH